MSQSDNYSNMPVLEEISSVSCVGRNGIGINCYRYLYPSIIMRGNIVNAEQPVWVETHHSPVQQTVTDVNNSNGVDDDYNDMPPLETPISNNINDDYNDMPPLETAISNQNLKRKFTEE